jgi:organic radical activating enzyme
MNDEYKKFWPIKSDTSCYLKWSWSTIYLNRGTTASCHRTVHNHFTAENFDDFHNLPKKLDDRRRMLAGGWPEESETTKWGINGCTYCKHIEDQGGVSDRIVQLQNLGGVLQNHDNAIPPELLSNPDAVEITPTIVEVYFNNVCNMACLYCGPHFSTMWEEENRRFNAQEDGILVNPSWERDRERYYAMRDKLFVWLREHGHKIWNFGMLGGEPFFQEEFDMVLDHWENYPNPNLMLTIVTNLKIEHRRFVKYIDRLKLMVETGKIKTLNISASLDCWGPQAEYLRWGLKLSEWEKNFAYMAPQEWIILNVNLTITPLSIKTLPELIEKINAWDHDRLMRITAKNLKIPPEKFQDFQDKLLQLVEEKTDPRVDVNKHICISFMHVLDPTQMNPLWFGPGVFTEDMQRVVELMPGFTEFQRSFKTYMQGIAISIENTTRDPKKILMLETYMNEMDRRRGTKWSDLFPWLVDQFAQARTELGELGE